MEDGILAPPGHLHTRFRTCGDVTLHGRGRLYKYCCKYRPRDGEISLNYQDRSHVITEWLKGEPFPAMVKGRQDHGRRSRDMPLLALKEEEGDHKPKNVGNSRRWKRQESKFFHRASRNASSLTTTLILMQWYLPQTSSPQKCKETNLCCLSH